MGDMLTSESVDNYLMQVFMYFYEDNRKLFGHEFANLIEECSFKGRNCANSR